MIYNSNQLLAKFILKGLAGTDTSELLDNELENLADQATLEFNIFKVTCDNTSKETQIKSIEKYFFHKGLLR